MTRLPDLRYFAVSMVLRADERASVGLLEAGHELRHLLLPLFLRSLEAVDTCAEHADTRWLSVMTNRSDAFVLEKRTLRSTLSTHESDPPSGNSGQA